MRSFSLLMFFLLGLVSTVNADVYVPDDLNAGDEYHLIFLTQGTRDALSIHKADYNNFAHGEATLNPALTGTDEGVTYKAIASVPSEHAWRNSLIEAPVYLLDGTRIADGFADMWDGEIAATISINQFGAAMPRSTVWTGTVAVGGFRDSHYPLGPENFDLSLGGYSYETGSRWTEGHVSPQTTNYHMYALSEKLTVSAVPEPASFILLLGLGLAGVCRRSRRD